MLSTTHPINYIKSNCRIEFATPNKIFTPDHNRFTGTLEIRVLQDISGITSIDYGFRGIAVTRLGSNTNGQSYEEDKFNLFNQPTSLLNNYNPDSNLGSILRLGEKIKVNFGYEFPTQFVLPSSCENFGDTVRSKGSINILYQIYLKIGHITHGTTEVNYFEYTTDLKYQGNSNIDSTSPKIAVSTTNLFPRKLKILVPNEPLGILQKNVVEEPHHHSRYVRQLFDENYTSSNMSKITKNISLIITCGTSKEFNIASPLTNISITIETSNITKLSPDFVYNGQSTLLGLFEIDEVEVKLDQFVHIECCNTSSNALKSRVLFFRKFVTKPNFDIKDFNYNNKRKTFFVSTTLGALIHDTDITIFSTLRNPLMGDLELPNYFSNMNTLTINITISNAQMNDNQSRLFKFKINPKVICNLSEQPKSSAQRSGEVELIRSHPTDANDHFPGNTEVSSA